MNIRKIQSTSFKSKLSYPNPEDAKNVLLIPIKSCLESCGGEKVEHEISLYLKDKTAMVFTYFKPDDNKPGKFCRLKKLDLLNPDKIKQQIESIKIWLDKVKHQEISQ